MKVAILADVKANGPALSAVLKQVHAQGVDRCWFIGSLLTFGPDPVAVVDAIRRSPDGDHCLLGYPDGALLNGAADFNPTAQRAFRWARSQMQPRWWSGWDHRARWAWIRARPAQADEGTLQLFACTPVSPAEDFLPIFGVAGQDELQPHMKLVRSGSFVGSVSRPGIVFADDLVWQPMSDGQCVPIAGRRFIACPGAVGQPRDRDPRAAYAIHDGETITWHRVPYDVGETVRRLRQHPDLDGGYGLRLEQGV